MVGTGPFQFESYTPKVATILAGHADYFRGTPKLERINYRYIPADNARELAFAAGEIDLFYGRREQGWVEWVHPKIRQRHERADLRPQPVTHFAPEKVRRTTR